MNYLGILPNLLEEPKKKLVKKPYQRPVPGLVLSPRTRRQLLPETVYG